LLTDPDTLLLTGVYAENVTRAEHLALIECELTADDVNKFVDLARYGIAAASLSAATDGDLARSARWLKVYQPAGYGDEMRGVFSQGAATWGHFCLTRGAADPVFADAEVDVMVRLCPHVANGIRACLQLAAHGGSPEPTSPALLIIADDGSVESMTPQVSEWFGPIDDESLGSTIVLHEVAQRARVLAEHGVGEPAMARSRGRSGEWFVVRGVRLDGGESECGRTAVLLEPASRSDIAPLLLQMHQLTRREKEITRLLLTGMATRDIASELWITADTLRGHVKSVFAKLGVKSRPELAALLSQEPVVRT
jgi:DNA-binding CsgD family transcriptional regulator